VAPALHSLIVSEREDVVRIVESLFYSHVVMRKLILKNCNLDGYSTCILAHMVARYAYLEVLSLDGCSPLHSAAYSYIPRLKKLSELNLTRCQVRYVYVQLLQTDVRVCEHM
jgi:hypothetical protein